MYPYTADNGSTGENPRNHARTQTCSSVLDDMYDIEKMLNLNTLKKDTIENMN